MHLILALRVIDNRGRSLAEILGIEQLFVRLFFWVGGATRFDNPLVVGIEHIVVMGMVVVLWLRDFQIRKL